MILELNGTKVTIVDKTLGYQGDNLVDTIQVTVDKDSTWNYKLDMYKGKSKCFDSVLMTREGNICTVQLTNEILSYGGRYIFQLRGYTDTQTYHSDIFESWVNASIEYQDDCKQTDCGCDCKLPTEFYQVEDNVTEINNHPPYPGDNNKWMIWDVDRHEYVESDIEVIGGGGGDYQTKANLTTSITAESTDEQYPSAKATYDYGQSIAQSAGKINAITVNGTAQTVEDKTAKIIVNKSTVGLGNVNNTSDNEKPVSSAQASAIADAKQAGTTAQANLEAHIGNKENPHEVTKAQVGLSDVDNTSDKNKPVSTLQATAIADAKKAGTDAQANLTAHINDKENPHEVTKAQVGLGDVDNTSDANKPISTATQTALNGKLDKTAVVDVTVEALKGQAADAKSVYDAIQAAKPDIVTPTAESTDTQAASAKAVWDMLGSGGSGGGNSWEQFYTQTISEVVSSVVIALPEKYKRLWLIFEVVTTSGSNATLDLRFSNEVDGARLQISKGGQTVQGRPTQVYIEKVQGHYPFILFSVNSGSHTPGVNSLNPSYPTAKKDWDSVLNSVTVYVTNTEFAVGSKFMFWGCES